jgi:hypothetical protein
MRRLPGASCIGLKRLGCGRITVGPDHLEALGLDAALAGEELKQGSLLGG